MLKIYVAKKAERQDLTNERQKKKTLGYRCHQIIAADAKQRVEIETVAEGFGLGIEFEFGIGFGLGFEFNSKPVKRRRRQRLA